MKLSFRLKRVCGSVFNNGNIIFTPDGNSVLSPVGNRVNVFDLVEQTTTTLPFENKKNIKICAISNSGRFLVTVDVEGHALFINFPRRVVLQRFHFKRKVYDIKFSPNDEMFAITFGHGCQIWRTPGIQREFSPLQLARTITGQNDDSVCLDWSTDSQSLIIGSKDLSSRVYYRVSSKHMATSVLSGHRDILVGTFFSSDNDTVYTVAQDGAVFTWTFDYADRIILKSATKKSKISQVKAQSDNDSDNDDDSDDTSSEDSDVEVKTVRGGQWRLKDREFLWEPHTEVSSVAFNKTSNLLVVGFSGGVFGLYDMPGCVNIHRLSVSNHSLNTASINSTGEWLALGSSRLGQLLIWEWQSETYVLKQQGHLYGLNAVDYSSDGQFIASAGEDSKVKLWSTASGYCVVTFTEHIAPVTGIKFIGKGAAKAVISCSLDGSVRAHDLLRYKNFRTLTTATPVQFTCLAADPSGEIVCAGALDPFQIYVWALQTGRLLDVLSGHEGPVACLDFSPSGSVLASGSWDGTLKLWDVYKNECRDTFEHGCDVLSVAFRPDGLEVCTSATNGQLYFWDVESGTQLRTIEGRRDISGGRLSSDLVTAQNSTRSKHFTTVAYTPDGSCVLAGGLSKYTCIYSVANGTLVKKYQLSHNRSLDGMSEQLRSDRLVDGVALDSLPAGSMSDSDDELMEASALPGSSQRGRGQAGGGGAGDGSRTTRPQILTAAVRFSPTGREWAAATTQGLQIFSLDDTMLFAPTDLDTSVTPQAVTSCLARCEYGRALSMALQLSLAEVHVLKGAVDAVPLDSIELVVKSVDVRMLRTLLRFLAEQLSSSPHVEFYLRWCWEVLRLYGPTLQLDSGNSMAHREVLRSLIRVISTHERETMRMGDDNHFSLLFLTTQLKEHCDYDDGAEEGGAEEASADGTELKDFEWNGENYDEVQEGDEIEFGDAEWGGSGLGTNTWGGEALLTQKKLGQKGRSQEAKGAKPGGGGSRQKSVVDMLESAASFFGAAPSVPVLAGFDDDDIDENAELSFSYDRRGSLTSTSTPAAAAADDDDTVKEVEKETKKAAKKDRKVSKSVAVEKVAVDLVLPATTGGLDETDAPEDATVPTSIPATSSSGSGITEKKIKTPKKSKRRGSVSGDDEEAGEACNGDGVAAATDVLGNVVGAGTVQGDGGEEGDQEQSHEGLQLASSKKKQKKLKSSRE